MTPRPFRVEVPEAVLADLRERLERTRWPDEPPGAGWRYGTDLGTLQRLCADWRQGYDWRRHEAALNGFRQFTAEVAGITVHFIHEEGRGPRSRPLLLLHGWPGSVWEFHRILPILTDPARFGGDPAEAFTVVAPSLPGYGFSFRPGQPRFGIVEMAQALAALMTEVLGYARFAAQGGDWGAAVASRLALDYPERLTGIHLNLLAGGREGPAGDPPSEEERAFRAELANWMAEETGYQWIQGTRPQTLAYGLTDSPAGLLGWLLEKFRAWSDCAGDPERRFGRDTLLTNATIYWVTGCINASFWPYYARRHGGNPVPDGARITVPAAHASFPREILHPPRAWAERVYADLRRWTPMPRGGHFAALEEPEALARDIRAFFREIPA
jgi:microsomal epoxide hydrolase